MLGSPVSSPVGAEHAVPDAHPDSEVAMVHGVTLVKEFSFVHETVHRVLDKGPQHQPDDERDGSIEKIVVLGHGGLRPLPKRNVSGDYYHFHPRIH